MAVPRLLASSSPALVSSSEPFTPGFFLPLKLSLPSAGVVRLTLLTRFLLTFFGFNFLDFF
jgi:hypothetical protein